jgi:hypothetical protein
LNLFIYSFFGLIGLLLVFFARSVRKSKGLDSLSSRADAAEECGPRHIEHLPPIRQAFAETDYDFLSKNAFRELRRRVRRERRGVALAYLAALREDFQSLLRMARVIVALSPELAAVHEFERVRLTARFAWQYEMVRWKLWAGIAPVRQLDGLSDLVSSLSVRMESAMNELGERAAVASELASSMDHRGLGVV